MRVRNQPVTDDPSIYDDACAAVEHHISIEREIIGLVFCNPAERTPFAFRRGINQNIFLSNFYRLLWIACREISEFPRREFLRHCIRFLVSEKEWKEFQDEYTLATLSVRYSKLIEWEQAITDSSNELMRIHGLISKSNKMLGDASEMMRQAAGWNPENIGMAWRIYFDDSPCPDLERQIMLAAADADQRCQVKPNNKQEAFAVS